MASTSEPYPVLVAVCAVLSVPQIATRASTMSAPSIADNTCADGLPRATQYLDRSPTRRRSVITITSFFIRTARLCFLPFFFCEHFFKGFCDGFLVGLIGLRFLLFGVKLEVKKDCFNWSFWDEINSFPRHYSEGCPTNRCAAFAPSYQSLSHDSWADLLSPFLSAPFFLRIPFLNFSICRVADLIN